MDNKKALELLEKVKQLKDLREAIDLVRSEGLTKAVQPMESTGNGGELQHLGVHELSPGVLTHIIGTGNNDTHHYHCEVNMASMAKGEPHIAIKVVDHTGRPLAHAPHVHNDMKKAVASIVKHFNKCEW
jgi:hypothetical protein